MEVLVFCSWASEILENATVLEHATPPPIGVRSNPARRGHTRKAS
jgi:hypothetical protein